MGYGSDDVLYGTPFSDTFMGIPGNDILWGRGENAANANESWRVGDTAEYSGIKARYTISKKKTDVLFSGFPAGTVTGAPKIRAIQIIEELEKNRRNVYAGSVGYISADGNIDTCIALRTAVIKDKYIYIQSGAGIVADSKPMNEFKETENKALALLTACEQAKNFK